MADDSDPVVEPEVVVAETEGDPPVDPPVVAATPEPEPKPAVPDWRIDQVTKLRSKARELQAELDRYKAQAPADPAPRPAAEEIDRLANERAQTLAAQAAFNAQCDQVAQAGQKAYPDFQQKIHALTQLIDQSDPESRQSYNRFLEVAIATGEGEKLLHQLGSAPDEAARLMGLSPVRMAVEMAKMATAPSPQVSSAPKPINPLTNRGISHEAIDPADPDRADRLSTAQWIERRNKQLADRSAA